MKKEEIAEFYDHFSSRQMKIGANARLIFLFKILRKLGLRTDSKVLELGCGVGVFTRLLSTRVSNGIIEAVDLSAKSITVAKKNLQKKKSIVLSVADIVKYQPQNSDFDFITLMDVIEHIPLDQHDDLFYNLAKICNQYTKIVINIPNPQYIAYTREHAPEQLQVIDQEVYLFPLLQIFEKNQLELVSFEKHSIWEVEDYHLMVVRLKRPFTLVHLSDERSLHEKIVNKLKTIKDAILYR